MVQFRRQARPLPRNLPILGRNQDRFQRPCGFVAVNISADFGTILVAAPATAQRTCRSDTGDPPLPRTLSPSERPPAGTRNPENARRSPVSPLFGRWRASSSTPVVETNVSGSEYSMGGRLARGRVRLDDRENDAAPGRDREPGAGL